MKTTPESLLAKWVDWFDGFTEDELDQLELGQRLKLKRLAAETEELLSQDLTKW